jgi:hypothetical protein
MFMLALALLFLSAGSAMAEKKDKDLAQGREQLVEAFDAAWTRVVNSGEYRSIIENFNEPIPGVIDATEYITNISDCLPNTVLTPFPEKPVGLLKQILADGVIRRGFVASSVLEHAGGTTSDWFTRGDSTLPGNSDQSAAQLTAMLAVIADHYNTGLIDVVSIEVPFPFNLTSALLDGIFGANIIPQMGPPLIVPVSMPGVTVDFLDQVNAKGGRSENIRRLISRRDTCSFSASGQFIQIPAGSPLVGTIQSIDDLRDHPEVRICTGNLSTQLTSAYFPEHDVFASRGEDIVECYQRIVDGEADVMMSSLPVLPTAAQLGVPGPASMAPSVDTHIVAGTPYWVAMEGIKCEAVFVPGPFPPGTFRECERINR